MIPKIKYIAFISVLFAQLSFSMEKDIDDLDWLTEAQAERDADSARQKKHNSKAHRNMVESFKRIPKLTFKDIIGEIPEEITRIVHKIKNNKYYEKCGLDETSHEILFVGPLEQAKVL